MRLKVGLRRNVLAPNAQRSLAPTGVAVGISGIVKAVVDKPILKCSATHVTGTGIGWPHER